MKGIIKLLCLMSALGIALSAPGSAAFAAEPDTELIYDMELSAGIVNNSVAGSSVDFQLTEGGTGTVDTNAEFIGGDGTVPYIAMSGSKEKLSFASTDSDLLGGSYTLEAWVQLKQTAAGIFPGGLYGRPFMNIMGGTTDLMAETNANVMVGLAKQTNTYNNSGESTVMLTWDHSSNGFRYCSYYPSTEFNHDNWYKFTLVREVTPEDSGSKISKRLYFNGSQYLVGRGGQYAVQTYTTDTPYTETEVSFAIGSYDEAFEVFNIAEVKLYKGARTAAEITADSNSEKLRYTELDLIDNASVENDIEVSAEGITELTDTSAVLVNMKDQSEVGASCRVETEGVITVTPDSYLLRNATYLLSFEDSAVDMVLIKTEPYEVAVGEAVLSDGIISVPLSFTGDGTKKIEVIAIARNAENKILGIRSSVIPELSGADTAQVNMSEFAAEAAGYKLLLWEHAEGYIKSAADPMEL